jgi:hypothetical protein
MMGLIPGWGVLAVKSVVPDSLSPVQDLVTVSNLSSATDWIPFTYC